MPGRTCRWCRLVFEPVVVGRWRQRILTGRTLNDDTLNALISWRTGIMLVHLVPPHAGKLGLHSGRTDGRRGAALFSHRFDTCSLSFGNEALDCDLGIGGSFGCRLLVDGKLFFLQLKYSF
jgi:hypothetical protein